jgi:uncharacterized protein YkwD
MISLILPLLLSVFAVNVLGENDVEEICLNDKEKELYQLIMEYRNEKGLNSISLSPSLSKVAQTHVNDLNENYKLDEKCNAHSWSRKGKWTSCCYTEDHKKAECMWDKPKELAEYNSKGYEIVSWGFPELSALTALKEWQKSPGHNPLLINSGVWEQARWQAIGIGLRGNYAAVWFGVMKDTNSEIQFCD